MSEKNLSGPAQLASLVWQYNSGATRHSWTRINHAMDAAVRLAIGAGMQFELDDIATIVAGRSAGYWANAENWYTLACLEDNLSACHSLEKYLGRKPIICDDVSYPSSAMTMAHTSHGGRRKRVCIRASFEWKDERVKVTSFTKNGEAIACFYQRGDEAETCRKILRRYTISADDVKTERAERQRRNKIKSRLAGLRGAFGERKVYRALGLKKTAKTPLREQYAAIATERLEEVAEKLEASTTKT